jgi:hypothetical protein
LNQYALTGDAYNFWTNLKTNTEELGSIFDAQPSNINGNIHNIANSSEPVIGYISACTVQSKRIFISSAQLPKSFNPVYPYNCMLDSVLYCTGPSCTNNVATDLVPPNTGELPILALQAGPSIIGYLSSTTGCVDCTIRGTNVQPPFWK